MLFRSENGNTVLVIEHNLDVIKTADHIIDLGPEGGDAGGHVVAAGTPEEIAANPDSYTGRYLANVLPDDMQASLIKPAVRKRQNAAPAVAGRKSKGKR